MSSEIDFINRAESAAEITIKDWIREALRESFLQALRQVWSVRHNEASKNSSEDSDSTPSSQVDKDEEDTSKIEIQAELSSDGVNACFSFAKRVSQAWQIKLKEERHERVARWVEEVYQQGKPLLWAEQRANDNDSGLENTNNFFYSNQRDKKYSSNKGIEIVSENSTKDQDTTEESRKSFEGTGIQASEKDENSKEKNSPGFVANARYHPYHPNVYFKLRALGRRLHIDSPVMSVSDALHEIKKITENQPTYWPLDNDIIDEACLDLSRRMRVRDKHGPRGYSTLGNGDKSFTKKAVRFNVLPKSVWETKQNNERSRNDEVVSKRYSFDEEECQGGNEVRATAKSTNEIDPESKVENLLLASMKRKKSGDRSHRLLETYSKKPRRLKHQQMPRAPFDIQQYPDGNIWMDLPLEEKKLLDKLLILDDEVQETNTTQDATIIASEKPLILFGGLQHVGQTNFLLQNPETQSDTVFMTRKTDKITRRKEKISIQERLDPNRVGRAGDLEKRKSKVLRTEDWFDDQKKFFDFDLGWCLLEMKTEGNQKRLCAFSSMEICLEDTDSCI